jgi:hypothetical protein
MLKREDVPTKKNINGVLIDLTDAEIDEFVEKLNTPEVDERPYNEKRLSEYPSIDELIVALWEGVVEERMASVTALEGLRQAVKTKYPKP